MAKARAICTCATCGSSFEKTAIKRNRKETEEWEEWAVKTFDECPACWRKGLQQEELEKGLICKVRLMTEPQHIGIWYVGHGDTYQIKDALKEDGWRWTDAYPNGEILGGVLSTHGNQKRWAKEYMITDVEAEKLEVMIADANEKAIALGFKIEVEISEMDLLIAQDRVKVLMQQKEKELQEKQALDEKRGPKPQRPDWMPDGRWNGTIYGKKEKSIYINGDKLTLTEEQTQSLSKYLSNMDTWKSYESR